MRICVSNASAIRVCFSDENLTQANHNAFNGRSPYLDLTKFFTGKLRRVKRHGEQQAGICEKCQH